MKNIILSVLFVDCGQGDCILIKTENEQVLVDCGGYFKNEWCEIADFKWYCVSRCSIHIYSEK